MKRVDYRDYGQWQEDQFAHHMSDPGMSMDQFAYIEHRGTKILNPYISIHGYPVDPNKYYGKRAFQKWKQRVNNLIRMNH